MCACLSIVFLYFPLFPIAFKLEGDFEANLSTKKISKNSKVPIKIIKMCTWIDILLIPPQGKEVGALVKDLTLRKFPF